MNRWKLLVTAGFVLLLAVGSIWAIHLVRHSDTTLARWASIANIVGLPIAFVALLVGLVTLLVQRSPSDSERFGSQTTEYSPQQTIGAGSEARRADHGSTYIEIASGSLSIAQPGQQRPSTAKSANERTEKLLFRAVRITTEGESQEVEIFDAEIADKWIKKDPWGSERGTGAEDGE